MYRAAAVWARTKGNCTQPHSLTAVNQWAMFDGEAHRNGAMEAPHFSGGTLAPVRVLNARLYLKNARSNSTSETVTAWLGTAPALCFWAVHRHAARGRQGARQKP